MSERELQRTCVREFRKLRFIVIETSNRRATMNTRGTPDAFVYTGEGKWVALEFKIPSPGRSRGKVSMEQDRLEKTGAIHVVTSIHEAFRAVTNHR